MTAHPVHRSVLEQNINGQISAKNVVGKYLFTTAGQFILVEKRGPEIGHFGRLTFTHLVRAMTTKEEH